MFRTQGSLRRQLLLPLLLFETVSLIIIGLTMFLVYRGQLQGTLDLQRETAVGAAKEVVVYLRDLQADLLNASLIENLTNLTPDQQSQALDRLQVRQSSYVTLIIVDQEGHEQLRAALHSDTPTLPDEWKQHEAFSYILAGEAYNGAVEFHTGLPYMLMAAPIRDPQLRTVGMLVAQVDLSSLWNVVATAGSGQSGYVYVVDRAGNLVAARNMELVVRQPDVKRLKGVQAALDDEQPTNAYGGLTDERVIGGMGKVTNIAWRVIAELPTREAYAQLNSLLLLLGFQILVGVAAAIGIWFYVSNRVVEPILEITRGAQLIGEGNLDHQVEIETEGELSHLAHVLNSAAAQRKAAEEERARLQQEIIDTQKRVIQELSTPIIPVTDDIIVMPLVGSIDTFRAKDIMRSLMTGIRERRARIVILDITGVPIVDSGVASHLNKTIQAARLKGAHTIITGVSNAVAETIVELGIDWSGVETLSDLQTGLSVALKSLGIELAT